MTFGARAAKRQQGLLEAAATAEAGKAEEFEKKYGQSGKARGYATEMADLAKLGPEANEGVLYQSWVRQKKLFVDSAHPNMLIRQKRRLNGTTQKFLRQLPPSEAERESGKNPRAMIVRTVKTRGSKTIDSEYSGAGQLKRKLKLRSGGRFKEKWETDSNGELIRTRFRTDRLRDGVVFSKVSEHMSELDQNGKRLLVRTKGRRIKRFERDEKTGKLTLTAREGLFSSEHTKLKTDGSLDLDSRKVGKLWQKDVQYVGEDSKRVTTKILGIKSIRTVPLTSKERAEQQRRRDDTQKPEAQVIPSAGRAFGQVQRLGHRPSSSDSSSLARVTSEVGPGTEKPFSPVKQDQQRSSHDERMAALFESAKFDDAQRGGSAQPVPVSSVASIPEPATAGRAFGQVQRLGHRPSSSDSSSLARVTSEVGPGTVKPFSPVKQDQQRSSHDERMAALFESAKFDDAQPGGPAQPVPVSPVASLTQPMASASGSRFSTAPAFGAAFPAPKDPIRQLGSSPQAVKGTGGPGEIYSPARMNKSNQGPTAQPTAPTSGSRFAKGTAFSPAFLEPAAVSTPTARTFEPRDDRARGAANTV